MAWLQAGWHDYALDELRTAAQMDRFISDQRVGKIFIEPHLAQTLGLNDPKVRFQGCRAARHDDHIHIQLNRGGTRKKRGRAVMRRPLQNSHNPLDQSLAAALGAPLGVPVFSGSS